MKSHLIIFFGLIVISKKSFAQTPSSINERKSLKEKTKQQVATNNNSPFWANTKEVGLNFTPLISKLVPFNIGDKSSGFIGIKTKYYGQDYAFRMTFGSDISSDQINFFHFGLGYERRRILSKSFNYTTGWETLFEASSEVQNQTADVLLGVTKFYGLEYNISETFFIGTEAQLILGISAGRNSTGPEIRFRAPIAIFANVRLYNKR